jgi:hypothetical protein
MTSEFDDNLHDALAQNGTFDPGKAAASRRDAVEAFGRAMKKVERITWKYVIALAALGAFAILRLMQGGSTKTLILYAILLGVAFEVSTLMKLWYWIMNTKLNLLREVTQLRLELATGGKPEVIAAGDSPAQPARRPIHGTLGCSRRERTLWYVVLFTVLILVAVFVQGREVLQEGLTSEGYVTLSADGSGSAVTRVSYVHYAAAPLVSFDFYSGGPKQDIRWIDGRGREMPATVSEENGQTRYRVRLIEPVMPGEPVQHTRITESASIATKEGELWVFRQDLQHGFPANRYNDTVLLPRGAELVSADPEPSRQYLFDRSSVLVFRQSLDRQEHFRSVVQYRLP